MNRTLYGLLLALATCAGLAACTAPAHAAVYHTADTSPDYLISLSELLRVIQFYNVGGLHCEGGTEDGFDPEPGDTGCAAHDSDYAPQDWVVSLSELLRLIQFYNTPGYHPCADLDTEDGFCAGLGEVSVPDPALEAALRDALGKPSGPLLPGELASITEFNAPLGGITDLTGLEACTGMVTLDLHGNCIADLSPLAGLTALTSLNLHENAIVDVTALAGLTELRQLWLDHNLIADPSGLLDNPGLGNTPANTWDRVALAFNPLNAPNAAQAIQDFRDRGVGVWADTPPGAATASCAPAEQPGDPIPLDVRLIHGDPAVDDANAYVMVLLGDAYAEDDLDDPTIDVADVPAQGYGSNDRGWSKSAADAMHFFFSQEPFAEYAAYFKIYRVDLLSNEGILSDNRPNTPIVHDTALGMANESLAFSYDDDMVVRIASATGLPWDRIVLMPNATGSGKNIDYVTMFSNARFSRTMTGLHELGHGIGLLTDEYEYKHGTNPPASEPPGVRVFPNAISTGEDIPAFEDIPWRHWLESPCPAPDTALGEMVNFGCVAEDCQCSYAADFMDCVPLPTCEPGGNFVDVDGKIYGRLEWPEPDELTTVGLFEGAWFRTKGAYRPELRCRMRSDDDVQPGEAETPRFCKVCREALTLEVVSNAGSAASVSPANDTPVPVANAGGNVIFGVGLHVPATPEHMIEVVSWEVDAQTVANEHDVTFSFDPSGYLPGTEHEVAITLRDLSPFVHPNFVEGQARLLQRIAWQVNIE